MVVIKQRVSNPYREEANRTESSGLMPKLLKRAAGRSKDLPEI